MAVDLDRLDGKHMYFHQSNELAERTIEQVCNTLKLGGVNGARIKVCQWLTWTGRFDTGPAWDINSLADVIALQAAFKEQSIDVIPWVVPMGLDASGNTATGAAGIEAEAQRFAAIANAAGAIDFDCEPYPEFWPAVAAGDYRAVRPLFARVRELTPDKLLICDIPFRNSDWERGKLRPFVERMQDCVDAFYLQNYFGLAEMQNARDALETLTDKPIYSIVGATQFLKSQVDWLDGENDEGIAVWVAQTMNGGYYAELARHDFGSTNPPEGEITWQQPGFSTLYSSLGNAGMGQPIDLPFPDNFGNVFQDSNLGTALWLKNANKNYWLVKDSA